MARRCRSLGGDGLGEGADDARDDAVFEHFLGDFALLAEGVEEGGLGVEAPELSDGEVEAELVLGEGAGAEVLGVGAGLDGDAALEARGVVEGDGHDGLVAGELGAGLVEEPLERGGHAEDLGDEFVVVSVVGEVESEDEVEGLAVELAEAEHVGREFEDGLVLSVGLGELLGVDVSGAESVGFDGEPAVGAGFLVALEDEVSVVAGVELGEVWKPPFHLLKVVKDGFAVVGEFEFGVEVEVDVVVVGERLVVVHPVASIRRSVGGRGRDRRRRRRARRTWRGGRFASTRGAIRRGSGRAGGGSDLSTIRVHAIFSF